jgi:hypothetical protein
LSSVASPPSRARIALWIAAAVVLLTASVLVLVFGRDSGGQAAAPTTTLSQEQELAKLRAEAVEAAQTYFPRKDAAEAAGDPSMLDGMFLPGSNLAAALKKQIADRRAKGEIQETQNRTEQIEILALDQTMAEVRFVNVVLSSAIKDINTGEVKQRFGTGHRTWRLFLTRAGDRWLVRRLTSEETVLQEGTN